MFIKLHNTDNEVIRVNMNNILRYEAKTTVDKEVDGFSVLYCLKGTIWAKETPEEIDVMIKLFE